MDSLLFDEYFEQQAGWIHRQLRSNKTTSFVDYGKASVAYDSSLIALSNKKEIAAFRKEHLSKEGLNKLYTTLRVYRNRQLNKTRAHKLDVTLSQDAFKALEYLALESSLSKRAVLEGLLIQAHKSVI